MPYEKELNEILKLVNDAKTKDDKLLVVDIFLGWLNQMKHELNHLGEKKTFKEWAELDKE